VLVDVAVVDVGGRRGSGRRGGRLRGGRRGWSMTWVVDLAVVDVGSGLGGRRRGGRRCGWSRRPTSLSRGEGHRLAWTPWLGAKWGGEVVVAGRREDEPTSTINAVDVAFKLRSHAQRLRSISAHMSTIRKIKILLFK